MADDTVTAEAPVFQGPALSATSDAPVVEKPATPPEVNTEVNKAADTAPKADDGANEIADAENAEAETDTGSDDTGQTEESTVEETGKAAKAEIPPYAKREITKARNQKRDAEARTAAAEDRAKAAEARLDLALKAEADGDAKPKVADTPRPKRDTFDNPDAYDDALVTWAADNAARKATAEVEAKAATRTAEAEQARKTEEQQKRVTERVTSWQDKRTAFMKDHPDFEDVAESDDVKISPAMTELLLEADNGPELAYALGKDPELSAKIASLSPAKAALEMGKFAASVEAAKKPKVSKTPPPAKPIGSRANAGQKSPDEMSMDEYAAMRTPQILAERAGPMARHRAN